MPIRRREQIRVNPIDTMPNVAVGISIPFNGDPVFNSTYTTKDQIKTNLINYFLTDKGERIMNPDFGGNLRSYVFEQTPQFDDLKTTLTDDINQYFPMIVINDLNISVDKTNHQVNITLNYSINNSADQVTLQIIP